MKYPYLLCLAFLVCVLPVSCNFTGRIDDTSLTGLWETSTGEDAMYATALTDVFLNLGADKKYTFYLPYYFDYGTWEVFPEDSVLRLTSARKYPFYGKKWNLRLQAISSGHMRLAIPGADKLHGLYIDSAHRYERIVFSMPEYLDLNKSKVQFKEKDPFSITYNQWRIRPTHRESCDELKKRITGHMQHLAVLFDGFSHSSSETVGYEHSPNPFVLAANGVGMQSFSNVPAAYNYIFYDRQDAITAYYLTEGFFHMKLNFPKYDKYSELWASVFKQMIQQGDTANLCGLLQSRIDRFRKDSATRTATDSAVSGGELKVKQLSPKPFTYYIRTSNTIK